MMRVSKGKERKNLFLLMRVSQGKERRNFFLMMTTLLSSGGLVMLAKKKKADGAIVSSYLIHDVRDLRSLFNETY